MVRARSVGERDHTQLVARLAPPSIGGPVRLLAMAAAGILAAGCGSGSPRVAVASHPRAAHAGASSSGDRATGSGTETIPAPGPTGVPADPAAVRVIRAWSSALLRGDVRGAARFFALPSEFINGPDAGGGVPVITIRTLAQAAAVNASLPCGAVFISADQRGRYVNALFRLANRPGPGAGCGTGAGQPARTNFVIVRGRITEWIRAPLDPSDSQGPSTPAGPGAPSAPADGPVV